MKTEIRNALQLTTKSGRTLLHDGCVLEVPVETQNIQLLRHCDFTHVILSACQRAQMIVKIENRCLLLATCELLTAQRAVAHALL